MKFLGFAGIMIAAVICGYLTARFIIAPLLGYDTEVLKLDFPSKLTSLLDKDDSGSSAQQDDEEAMLRRPAVKRNRSRMAKAGMRSSLACSRTRTERRNWFPD